MFSKVFQGCKMTYIFYTIVILEIMFTMCTFEFEAKNSTLSSDNACPWGYIISLLLVNVFMKLEKF